MKTVFFMFLWHVSDGGGYKDNRRAQGLNNEGYYTIKTKKIQIIEQNKLQLVLSKSRN